MLNNQVRNKQTVLVELSVVDFGGDGQVSDQIANVQNMIDKTKLFYELVPNGMCIEGQWSDISGLIDLCYEQVREKSLQNYLKVSIR